MILKTTLAAPFKHTRKESLQKSEFVYYFALDRKWMSIEQANLLLKRGQEENLLEFSGGVVKPLFNTAEITIPLGFKPGSEIFAAPDSLQDMIDRIAQGTKKPAAEVIAEMNRTIEKGFDGNLRPEAAVVLVAKEYGIPFEDKLTDLKESLLKNVKASGKGR
ncbi:MAG: DUF2240 family protein [Methanoregulaceae archaeon]